jgi:hypothetical protein
MSKSMLALSNIYSQAHKYTIRILLQFNCMVLSECDGPPNLPSIFLLCCLHVNSERGMINNSQKQFNVSAYSHTYLNLFANKLWDLLEASLDLDKCNKGMQLISFLTLLFFWSASAYTSNINKTVNNSSKMVKWCKTSCFDWYKWQCSLLTFASIANSFFLSSDIYNM